jgi:hypothetical protein
MTWLDDTEADIKTIDGQRKILMTCALRLKGYQYKRDTGFDPYWVYLDFFKTKKWNLSLHDKMAAFYFLQRYIARVSIPTPCDNRWWAYRSLFVEVADQEIPEEYRDERYWEPWEKNFKPHVLKYISYFTELIDLMMIPIEPLGKMKTRVKLDDFKKMGWKVVECKENESLTLSGHEYDGFWLTVNNEEDESLGNLPNKYCKFFERPITSGWIITKGRPIKTTSSKTLPIELEVFLTKEGQKVMKKINGTEKDQEALLNLANILK